MKYALLLALAACHHAKPDAQVYGGAHGRFVVGSKVEISATWNATCTDWGASFEGMVSKHDHEPGEDTKPCHKKAFEIELACSTKCSTPPPDQVIGSTSKYVIPLEVGPMRVTATSKRLDNGETKQFSFPVDVTMPDKLELHCAHDHGGSSPCGPDGVNKFEPTLSAVVLLDGSPMSTTLLRVNGKSLEGMKSLTLLDLYPDAKEGRGVKAGTYEVTLEVAGMVAKWQVVARVPE